MIEDYLPRATFHVWSLLEIRYRPRMELQTLSNEYSVREISFLELVPMAKYLIQMRNPLNHSGILRIKWVQIFPVSHTCETGGI